MKRILFILLSALFLQATMCIYMGASEVNATEITVCALSNDLKSNLSDEERTENNFYNFIRYDVIGKDNPIPKGILSYAGFSSANKVYGQIINWIVPASERQKFDKTKTFKSKIIEFEYSEDVTDGVAKLTVTFKNREDLTQCTVVFKSER